MKLGNNIDKLGTAGLVITALFSPCCFPLFAFAASALGLGSFELFGGWTMWVFLAMVLISIAGHYISYRKHHFIYPLLVAIASGLVVFYGYYLNDSNYWTYFLYLGMSGLFIATTWNYRFNKAARSCKTCSTYNGKKVALVSTITCPFCGHKSEETMPTDACVYFYECQHCKVRLKPLPADCCVYCSYGTMKCPPIQAGDTCCW